MLGIRSSFILLIVASKGLGWGAHYLVTDRALEHADFLPIVTKSVKVEPLESFLADQKAALEILFENYYQWLTSKKSKRFQVQAFDPKTPSIEMFLKSARLNPNTVFRYVYRAKPGEKHEGKRFPFKILSPNEREDRHLFYQFFEDARKEVSLRSVLSIYADEPDWQIDDDLWEIEEYGYGAIPYGKNDSADSGAAFHMQFAHEPWIVRLVKPTIAEGMALDRLELFQRLSKLAFTSGHPYWGTRFAAWGLHYIQDLSQPYHSKALPFAGLWFYLKFGLSTEKERIQREATQLVSNRHLLFEDFVRGLMEASYGAPNEYSDRIIASLKDGKDKMSDVKSVVELFDVVTAAASSASYELDQAVSRAFGKKMTEDPNYNHEKDPSYDSRAIYSTAPPELLRGLVANAERNLWVTGDATRRYLELCGFTP